MDTYAIFDLKVISLDQYYRNRARALFGRYFRDVSVIDWVDLEEPLEAVAPLTEKEREVLSVVDLLVRGRRKTDGQEVVLVIEVSWRIAPNDVERAAQRAEILGQRGISATPVVAGREIDDASREAARTANCALVMDGRFELDQPLRGA
jgi:hypothetical protein